MVVEAPTEFRSAVICVCVCVFGADSGANQFMFWWPPPPVSVQERELSFVPHQHIFGGSLGRAAYLCVPVRSTGPALPRPPTPPTPPPVCRYAGQSYYTCDSVTRCPLQKKMIAKELLSQVQTAGGWGGCGVAARLDGMLPNPSTSQHTFSFNLSPHPMHVPYHPRTHRRRKGD